jgi:Glycosyltransferase
MMNAGVFQHKRTLFLVWVAATHGSSRSRQLAEELGIREPHHIRVPLGSAAWTAPLRYSLQGVRTFCLLFRKRPGLVLVQSPPSHAVLFVRWYCRMTANHYIVDAHSDALQRSVWLEPSWLHVPATRDALVTLVHDDYFQKVIEDRSGRALVLRDPIGYYEWEDYPLHDGFSIAVVNRFAEDEPIEEVLQAAARIPSVRFYVTGNPERAPAGLLDRAPENVRFTGFLPNRQYYGLLRSSQAVMALTTRDHTFQCGANEALSLERPVITSAWQTLRDYFFKGAVFVDNTREGILEGVRQMVSGHEGYEREIRDLRKIQRAAWEKKIDELAEIVETGIAAEDARRRQPVQDQ